VDDIKKNHEHFFLLLLLTHLRHVLKEAEEFGENEIK